MLTARRSIRMTACGFLRGTEVHPAQSLAYKRGRGRLLLRFRQRRPLAALPYCAHAADFSAFRLGALPEGKPEVCGGRPGGDGRHGTAGASGPGLPLWVVAAPGKASAAGRTRRHFLAHSLAELRGLCDLPVAARIAGWSAG